jgi:hypothetical protein
MTRATYGGIALQPTSAASQMAPKECPVSPQTAAVMQKAHELFPRKMIAEMVAITGASETTVKRWDRGSREIGLEHYSLLLHSPHGYSFLSAVMEASEQNWWQFVKMLLGKYIAGKLKALSDRVAYAAFQGAVHADEKRKAKNPKAPAFADTFFFHDEEFMRSHRDALEFLSSSPISPVVAPPLKVAK